MQEKLSFDEIKARYNEEWVELIDCDWPEDTPWPKAGFVRVHHPKRKEFWKLVKQNEPVKQGGAVLFIGPPDPPDVLRNNLMAITVCEK